MRIFNGTNSLLTLPLSGNQKLEILPKSVSQEFMGSTDFLSMVVTSLSSDEIAIVVSGVYELNTCANIPTAVNYVVQTLDEAITRFGIKKKEPEHTEKCTCEKCKAEETKPEPTPEPIEETKPTEEPEPVTQPVPEEEPVVKEEKPVEEKPTKKNKKKAKK
jgi:outer membrane biosynthesis protein TonB